MLTSTQQPEGAHHNSNRTTSLLFSTPAWFLTSSDSKPKSFQWPPRATAISATSAPACSCPHSAPATVASQLSKPAHHANTPGPLHQPFLGLTCCTPTPTEHMAHLSPTSSSCPQINFSPRPPPISLFTNTAAPAPSHSLSSPHPTLLSPTYT